MTIDKTRLLGKYVVLYSMVPVGHHGLD